MHCTVEVYAQDSVLADIRKKPFECRDALLERVVRFYVVVSLRNQLENLLTDARWCLRNPIFASHF